MSLHSNVFVTLCVSVILIALAYMIHCHHQKNKEAFLPSFSIISDKKPEDLSIYYDVSVLNEQIKSLTSIKNVTLVRLNKSNQQKTSPYVTLQDAYTFGESKSKELVLSTVDSQKVAYFIKPLDVSKLNFLDDGVVIGYVNNLEKTLINNIYSNLKDTVKVPKYTLKKIDIGTNVIDKEFFSDKAIDMLLIFETFDSKQVTKIDDKELFSKNDPEMLISKIDENMKLDIVDYAENIDIQRIKIRFPYVQKKNIDFWYPFPQLRKNREAIVRSVIVFDILATVNSNILKDNVENELKTIIVTKGKPELINYYGQYFKMHPLSLTYAKNMDKFIDEREGRPILEQFRDTNDDSFIYTIPTNVNGFYDSVEKTLLLKSAQAGEIPLRNGTKLLLKHQIRHEENGEYVASSVSKNQSVLQKMKEIDNTQKYIYMGYRCYDNPNITIKGLCESPNDEFGNRKLKMTYWDEPCKTNAECPFYQANRNYKNYRGGCIDGRCEMPLGVKAVSYRLYDKQSVPLCYNCNDVNKQDCCEEQKDKNVYTNLITPDYVFELDEFERKSK